MRWASALVGRGAVLASCPHPRPGVSLSGLSPLLLAVSSPSPQPPPNARAGRPRCQALCSEAVSSRPRGLHMEAWMVVGPQGALRDACGPQRGRHSWWSPSQPLPRPKACSVWGCPGQGPAEGCLVSCRARPAHKVRDRPEGTQGEPGSGSPAWQGPASRSGGTRCSEVPAAVWSCQLSAAGTHGQGLSPGAGRGKV